MAMTELQLINAINTRWSEQGLITYDRPVGLYILKMQSYYNTLLMLDIMASPGVTSYNILWIMAYAWAALKWKHTDANLSFEALETLPLEITGVDWIALKEDNYVMMINTFITCLATEWGGDTATLWTSYSVEDARHLFQVCKQYLLQHGIAE